MTKTGTNSAGNKIYAVLTGDIVKSSSLDHTQRSQLFARLKEAFAAIKPILGEGIIASDFSIFRGDSFQGVLNDPSFALKTAILIRASLKAANPGPRANLWDARIAVGIGTINYFPKDGAEADGEAFHLSGPSLDAFKKNRRIHIITTNETINKELKVECHFLDTLMDKWSAEQAAVVLEALRNSSQETLAEMFSISQPAIRKRLQVAGFGAIEDFFERFDELTRELAL
ncbi:MAG: SatD family protein [Bacteroidales bacterium]|nr:SatD family protein [Bacteroidales bacterium]MCF8455408.1 SatD family protein [Bacteroidales bacterium]